MFHNTEFIPDDFFEEYKGEIPFIITPTEFFAGEEEETHEDITNREKQAFICYKYNETYNGRIGYRNNKQIVAFWQHECNSPLTLKGALQILLDQRLIKTDCYVSGFNFGWIKPIREFFPTIKGNRWRRACYENRLYYGVGD